MGNRLINFLFVLVGTLIVIIISHQFLDKINSRYDIEVAGEYSSADTVSFKGLFIRDEEVINERFSGVLSYPVTDGGKVAKGSVVAYVYNSEKEIDTNRKIEELEDAEDLLRSAQNPGTVQTADPAQISSLISEEYQTITSLLAKNDIAELKAHRDNLFTLMCIYQIAVDQEHGYDQKIADLAAKQAELRKDQRDHRDAIQSPDSGYFVSYSDGFEKELTFDNADELTADKINDIIERVKQGSRGEGLGKLIKGYDWKIAGVIDNSANIFNPGDKVTLSFASVSDKVRATIERLTDISDGKAVVVLRCDEMTYNLVRLRTDKVNMTLHDFEGIRVPRSAVRFNRNNEKGCYVLWGQRVLFKKIDEIYENDEYLLSRITSDENYVCVYDNIIKNGVDTFAYLANVEEETTAQTEEEQKVEYFSEEDLTEDTGGASETTAPGGEEAAEEETKPKVKVHSITDGEDDPSGLRRDEEDTEDETDEGSPSKPDSQGDLSIE